MSDNSNFRLQVVTRIGLVLVFSVLAFYFWVYTPFSLMVFWMALFAAFVLAELVRFVERSNRDLSNFLLAIKQNDFSNIYPEHNKKTQSLYHAFNVITREFIKLRSEKETNFHFFKTVVEHSRVPLMAYDLEDNRVTLMNESAKELLHIPFASKLTSLKKAGEDLYRTIKSLESDQKILLKTKIGDSPIQLSIVARTLVLQQRRFKVLALYNLDSELDQQEIESWQKLIRVLTHEIKNSVIPIATLTEVINQMVSRDDGEGRPLDELDAEEEEDLRISLQTIEKRSKGLVKFVNSYGDLARMPKPEPEPTNMVDLVRRIVELEGAELQRRGIKLTEAIANKELIISVDPGAIEQVLINLLKNAMEALEGMENGSIIVYLKVFGDKVILNITDNGPGIDDETLGNIFVPFYTTKKEGSGIGLPFCRQIMRAHGGNIKVQSQVGAGTTFELQLPNH